MKDHYEIVDDRFEALINTGSARRQLASGMHFTEGPAWIASERCVLFTDIPSNAIMRWDATAGLTTWNANSHFAIGLYADANERILSCEHSTRRITRYEKDGSISVLASHYGAHILNSTNDVCVRQSDGAVFFTDPPFGVRYENGGLHGYQQAMEYGRCGVFKVTGDPTQPHLVTDQIYRPNGLCFSPDERTLYVSDSSEAHHCVYALTLDSDDTVTASQVFTVLPQGVPDGMRVDTAGRLYVAGLDGVYVYEPDGTLLGKLLVPEMVTNLCFGGAEGRTLFITAVSSLYAFDLTTSGHGLRG